MKKILLAGTLLLSATLVAQDLSNPQQLDTVTLGTKVPIAREHSGKVITKITQEQLATSSGVSVATLINEVAGIEINGSRSNDGQNLGYYVRGGRNRQVVIMVDGVQLNDPSQIANDYDLRLVPTETIESIEILKGASSVLYGSGAATAVISITTKKASKEKISATFTSVVGTNRAADTDKDYDFEEVTNHVGVNGTLGSVFYDLTFGNRYVNGLSAAAAVEGEDELESDIFNRFNARALVGYHFNEAVQYSQFFSASRFKADFDNFDYTDAENQSITEEIKTGGHFHWKYNKGMFVFNDAFTWIEREIMSDFPARYDTKAYTFDTYATYQFDLGITAILGLNHNSSSFESFTVPFGSTNFQQDLDDDEAQFTIYDPYASLTYVSGFGLDVTAGARLNIHSEYGNHVVYNLNPSYRIPLGASEIKLLGSYSTAYITPSLFQLHDPLYGNLALEPEENATIEGGLVYSIGKGFRASALYFNRDEENFVDFINVDPENFVFQYQNTAEGYTASGIEVELYKKFGSRVNLSANYTFTEADERFALRIPKHKANARLGYQFSEKLKVGLAYQYNSDREDVFFNSESFESESVTLESYGLLDFNASLQCSKNLKLFMNLTNILDEEYEEVYRFETRGRNIRGGFTLTF